MRHIFYPLTTFSPFTTFIPPQKRQIDDSLKTRIEMLYSALSRLNLEESQELFKPKEFEVSFRRLETSMRRKEFVDAILDNAIGIEILLTRSRETESLKFKVERRGSYLLSPPPQRSKMAKKLGKLYVVRSKLVHSATEIKPNHVRELIGPVNEITNEERFKIRWEIFHLHRKILVQYLKALMYVWDSSGPEIKKHDDLIGLIDDLMLQESKIPRLYNQD